MPALQGNRGSGPSKGHALVDEPTATGEADPFVQNIFVLRHGEAVSSDDRVCSERPWDPPLSDGGKLQAWRVGRSFRMEEWNITRVVVSPFLRCVQTAAEVIAGLCLLPSSVEVRQKGSDTTFQPASSIKVSIECGLAEMMSKQGIPCPPQGADKNSLVSWTLDLAELYSMLPQEFHDTSYQPIKQTLPSCKETVADAQYRYISTFQKTADKFHTEHILCITHGEGVMQSVSMMWPRVEIHGVTYCAYTHAQRPNFKRDNGVTILSGEWELLTEPGLASGIFFNMPT